MPRVLPRALTIDKLLLVQGIYSLRSRIVIGISFAADRADCADILQPLGVVNRRILGGFNWSSQHLDLEVLRYGCREAPAGDSCDARADVVARQAVDRAARGSRAVLGSDRPRRVERGRGSRDGCVAGRWLEVVPAGWRDGAHLAGPAVGAVSVAR